MYTAKDGKRYGSAYVGMKKDRMRADHDEHEETPAEEKHESPEVEREEEKEGTEEQHPVVAEHGPAHKVVITHDHTMNKHHVQSHHKGGHINESDHQTPEEAHEEGGKLANISLKKTGEQEDQQLAASEGGNESTPDGFRMPPLA